MSSSHEQPDAVQAAEPPRWRVTITYRGDHGPGVTNHFIEELSELDMIVEHGPHWDCIENIIITRNGGSKTITTDQAARM